MSESSPEFTDPSVNQFTQLHQMASQSHEIFMTYRQAGFSRNEALAIVIAILTAPEPPTGE